MQLCHATRRIAFGSGSGNGNCCPGKGDGGSAVRKHVSPRATPRMMLGPPQKMQLARRQLTSRRKGTALCPRMAKSKPPLRPCAAPPYHPPLGNRTSPACSKDRGPRMARSMVLRKLLTLSIATHSHQVMATNIQMAMPPQNPRTVHQLPRERNRPARAASVWTCDAIATYSEPRRGYCISVECV